ncbi:hypothetical protein [Caldimonas tepidiphila]|uniref:hypothetical protein n=1 Tax=Caldimonas tepidiphila TaxID=2315841 RepID=UPI00196B94C5|nr:hypothetical protein [Caldimonas tepidiphila]
MKALFTIGAILFALAGCSTARHWESRFGDAVRQTREAQTLDPQAGLTESPLPLTDGKAVAGSLDKYWTSYGHGTKGAQQEVSANASGSAATTSR